jgi:hypothetical protein
MMMTAPAATAQEYLFDALVQYTVNVEYGFSFAQSQAGEPIPDQGARFDVYFEGDIRGPRLQGKVTGVDYLALGPDRIARMHVHAHITTHDGCHIAVHTEGHARRRPGSALADTYETVTFATSAEQYKWLNHVRAIGTGVANTRTGWLEVRVVEQEPRTATAPHLTTPGCP